MEFMTRLYDKYFCAFASLTLLIWITMLFSFVLCSIRYCTFVLYLYSMFVPVFHVRVSIHVLL